MYKIRWRSLFFFSLNLLLSLSRSFLSVSQNTWWARRLPQRWYKCYTIQQQQTKSDESAIHAALIMIMITVIMMMMKKIRVRSSSSLHKIPMYGHLVGNTRAKEPHTHITHKVLANVQHPQSRWIKLIFFSCVCCIRMIWITISMNRCKNNLFIIFISPPPSLNRFYWLVYMLRSACLVHLFFAFD